MGERKVLNKYFPPDFDPAKLPRQKRVRSEDKQMKVRMMLPMSVRCNTCGTYMYKGTKFNTRMEDVRGETYLGIKIFRFYYRCTACSAEFCMKTDPKTADYVLEAGATRNYEPWRETDRARAQAAAQREEEERGNAMKALENRTLDSKREMDIMTALDEMRSLKARHEQARAAAGVVATVDTEAALAALKRSAEAEQPLDLDAEDEAAVRQMLLQRAGFVRRLRDSDEEEGEGEEGRDGGGGGGGGGGAARRRGGRAPPRPAGALGPSVAAAAWGADAEEEGEGEDGNALAEATFRQAAAGGGADGGSAAPAGVPPPAAGGPPGGAVGGGEAGAAAAAAPPLRQPPPKPAQQPAEKPPPALPKFGARPVAVVVKRRAAEPAAAPGAKHPKQQEEQTASDGSGGGGALARQHSNQSSTCHAAVVGCHTRRAVVLGRGKFAFLCKITSRRSAATRRLSRSLEQRWPNRAGMSRPATGAAGYCRAATGAPGPAAPASCAAPPTLPAAKIIRDNCVPGDYVHLSAGLVHDLGHAPMCHAFEESLVPRLFPEVTDKGALWTHERQSCVMLDHIVQTCDVPLTEGQCARVKDMVMGEASLIVSNKETGIDVDKLDYLRRDNLACGELTTSEFSVLTTWRNVRVLGGRIAFKASVRSAVADVFAARARLHEFVYRHPVAKSVIDALALAADDLGLRGERRHTRTMQALSSPERFSLLDDTVLREIERWRSPGPRMQQARAQKLLARLQHRDLYTFAAAADVPQAQVPSFKDATAEDILAHQDAESGVALAPADIFVENLRIDFTRGCGNPLERVRFYQSAADVESFALEHVRVYLVRLFDAPEEKRRWVQALQAAFARWSRAALHAPRVFSPQKSTVTASARKRAREEAPPSPRGAGQQRAGAGAQQARQEASAAGAAAGEGEESLRQSQREAQSSSAAAAVGESSGRSPSASPLAPETPAKTWQAVAARSVANGALPPAGPQVDEEGSAILPPGPPASYQGAARPPDERKRLELLHALGVLDSAREDKFEVITKLLCSIFRVPISLISLGPPHLRFYAGAPLVSSVSNYRYGSLCVADSAPHRGEYTAEQLNLLAQFAELTVRAIEGSKLVTLQRMAEERSHSARHLSAPSSRSSGGGAPGAGPRAGPPGLTRAADCFMEGVLLVDAAQPGWPVLYTNEPFTAAAGVPRDEAMGASFWELFAGEAVGAGGGAAAGAYAGAVAANEPFTVVVGLQPIYSRSPKTVIVDFRPAATGQLDYSDQPLIGIPPWVASTTLGDPAPRSPSPAPPPADAEPAGGTAADGAADGGARGPDGVADGGARSLGGATGVGGAGGGRGGGPARHYFGIVRARPPSRGRSLPIAGSLASLPSTGGAGSLAAALAAASAASPSSSNGRTSLGSLGSLGLGPGGDPGGGGQLVGVMGLPTFKRAMPSAFTDVRLGPLIGRGAYGRVYRGSWNGNTVAVKVIETPDVAACDGALDGGGGGGGGGLPRSGIFEAVLSSNLSHPNIVHTYQYAIRPVERQQGVDGGGHGHARSKSMCVIWLVSEFCNRGPLLTAVERGAFLTQPSSQHGQPNLIASLQEIAAALQYLHSHDVLHGDLTGGNVLLTASDKDTRGFVCKVADFGLSRICSEDYLRTRTLGCAEYMPPELIADGVLTKAADVYAFGVILWEIYVGRRAWEGMKPTEVLKAVASHGKLEFPPQTPHRLKVLGERCMEFDPALRPTFTEEVNSILNDTMGILQQFLAASTQASAAWRGRRGRRRARAAARSERRAPPPPSPSTPTPPCPTQVAPPAPLAMPPSR
eukprot:scaffold4.g5032.t1